MDPNITLSFLSINALKLLCIKAGSALVLILSKIAFMVFHPKVIYFIK